VENVCMHGPRYVAVVQWPIYLGLLGRSAANFIECDRLKKDVVWLDFGCGWSRDYT